MRKNFEREAAVAGSIRTDSKNVAVSQTQLYRRNGDVSADFEMLKSLPRFMEAIGTFNPERKGR
jgi:hypothetical protein